MTTIKLLTGGMWMAAIMNSFGQPIITTQPISQSVEAGANVTFRVVTAGAPAATYQWRQNGVELSGATAASLTLPNVQSTNAGKYMALVTATNGNAASEFARLTVAVPTPLLAMTNRWKYNQSGGDLGASWKEPGYDDSNWLEGQALFYNETRTLLAPKSTLLALTNAAGQPVTTYYFRTHFSFIGTGEVGHAHTGELMFIATNCLDDGAVFYLNGVEIGRLRIPNGAVTASTRATIAAEGKAEVMLLSAASLVEGDNVLAVEVHQESVVNPDVVFGLSLKATTLAPPLPDLVIPPPPTPHIELQTFAANACEVREGCAIAGARRLLRFDIEARNAGTGDLVLGDPALDPQFAFDNCHGHYHFDHFAGFRLLDQSGAIVSHGRKIGFGLADVDRWDTTNASPTARFDGAIQHGISSGWSDIYSFQVACQYVDLTEVPAGSYILELEIDPHNKIPELDESNNITRITVEIPANWLPCATPPANDAFANAQMVPPGITTVSGTTECGTLEPGEPVIQDSYGNRGVKSIWFRWTAPATGGLTLDTIGSAFPTVLGLYSGGALNSLVRLGADVDFAGPGRASRVMTQVTAGESYSIALCGYFDNRGSVQRDTFGPAVLNIHLNTNDLFASAQTLHDSVGSARATTIGATKEADEPNHAGNPGGRSIWYAWTAPASGSMAFDTYGSTFNRGWRGQGNTVDTLLAVYMGDGLESLTIVAASDDATVGLVSRVTFNAIAGTTYYIAVDGRTGASQAGFCQLNWRPRLQLVSPSFQIEIVEFILRCEPGDDYRIESSEDLKTWTVSQAVVNSTGAELFREKPGYPRFYRARLD